MQCEMVCVFWGAAFVKTLTEFTLPSLLAPGNLPDWPYLAATKLTCYTRQSEWQQLQQHPVFIQLQTLLPIHWEAIDVPEAVFSRDPSQKYYFKAAINRQVLAQAEHNQRAFLQIIPDMVYTAGALENLAQLIKTGKEVVLHIGPRLAQTCLPALNHYCQGHVLNISPAAANQLLLDYLHPEYQGYFWLAPCFTVISPSMAFYWQNATTLIGQSYTPEPFFLRHPRQPKARFRGPLDGGYMETYEDMIAQGQAERMAVAGGDQMGVFSLTNLDSPTTEWPAPFPFAYRPALNYVYGQAWLSPSIFYDWVFAQTVTWTVKQPQATPFYDKVVPQAPWRAPLVLRHMTRLAQAGEWDALVDYWQDESTQMILLALTDVRLFFWADLVARAWYRAGSWAAFQLFATQYERQLLAAPAYLAYHCPRYAAYLPSPQSLRLYPQGWPGWEMVLAQACVLVWLDEYTFTEPSILSSLNITAQPIVVNHFGQGLSQQLRPLLQQAYPGRPWLEVCPQQEVPDLLADLIWRATTLIIPQTMRLLCQEQVLLAQLYHKEVLWL